MPPAAPLPPLVTVTALSLITKKFLAVTPRSRSRPKATQSSKNPAETFPGYAAGPYIVFLGEIFNSSSAPESG